MILIFLKVRLIFLRDARFCVVLANVNDLEHSRKSSP